MTTNPSWMTSQTYIVGQTHTYIVDPEHPHGRIVEQIDLPIKDRRMPFFFTFFKKKYIRVNNPNT